MTIRPFTLACALAVTWTAGWIPAQIVTAQSLPQRYTWTGQMLSLDARDRTVTMKVSCKEHVARYIGQFKPGERVIVHWGSPQQGETDAVIYVGPYDLTKTSHPDDWGYVLPVEFTSFDSAAKTITFRAHLLAPTFLKFKSIRPGQWVTVTSPFDQSKDTAAVSTVRVTEEPKDRVSDHS